MEVNQKKKIQILKKLFENDIESFGKFFFNHHIKLDTPEFHREIYDLYMSDHPRIAVGAPRGHAKSTITDLVYLCWCVVYKKTNYALLVSDTYSQSVLFLDALKAELESNEKLQLFFGKLTSDHWSEGEIVSNGIMITSIGAGMKVRGLKFRQNRPDLIIIDDLENDELVENKQRREKLERWVNGALIPCMAKGGRVRVIGTILHYDSLMAKLLSEDNYKEFLKKTYKAINDYGALWEEHLNLTELEVIKQDFLAKGQGFLFYQEYQNDPVSGENRKFKLEKIKYYKDSDILGKLLNTLITIDRAYSKDKTADSTGIIVLSIDQENNWYVRQAERFKGTEKELITKIFDLKSYYNPSKIGVEQKAFEYTLKPALLDEMRRTNNFFNIEELKDLGTSKNIRIEGLVPRFEMGTIFLKPDHTDLVDELIQFPKAVHDDLIDALAYQLALASGSIGIKPKQFIPQHHHYNQQPIMPTRLR